MFGYVTIYKPELKVKEFYEFRAFYCGLCNILKEKYGIKGQMTLSYDMTFLIMLLTSLYECETKEEKHHCMVHPMKSHTMLMNEVTEYGAAMNIALCWHHMQDDWKDEKKVSGLAGTALYHRSYQKVAKEYPRQCRVIEQKLKELGEYEAAWKTEHRMQSKKSCQEEQKLLNQEEITQKEMVLREQSEGIPEVDILAGCFGELMAELFVMREDRWEKELRGLGFYLGKFIYLMDAYEDLPEDKKNGRFNPLYGRCEHPDYEAECERIFVHLMAECTGYFEYLPVIKDVDILRNILYNGVWVKYEKIRKERLKGSKSNDEQSV